MKTIERAYHLENILLFTILSSYFLPVLRVSERLLLKIDDFIIIGALPLFLIYRPKFFKNPILSSLFICLILIILSTIYGYGLLNVPFSSRDLNEIIRLSKPILLILMLLSCDTEYVFEKVEQFITPLSWTIIFMAVLQYFNFLNIGLVLSSFYAPDHHIQNMVGSSHRIMVFGSDPNVGAAITMMFFLYHLFKGMFLKKKASILLTFLLVIVVLMTSSLTSFIALAISLLVFLLSSPNIKLIPKLIFSLFIAGVIVFLYEKFNYIAVGFALAVEGENNSVLHRFEKWIVAWNLFLQSPILGWGLAKGSMLTTVDGEYLLLLRRYGVIGTLSIMMSIICMPFWKRNKNKVKVSQKLLVWDSTLRYYLIVIIMVMVTNSFFSGYQLFLPFVFMCTLLYKERLKHA